MSGRLTTAALFLAMSFWLLADACTFGLMPEDPATGRRRGCYTEVELALGLQSPSIVRYLEGFTGVGLLCAVPLVLVLRRRRSDKSPGGMDASASRPWLLRALLVGVVYSIVGVVFAALPAARVWRLAAWAISAIVCSAHIGYEHFRLRNSSRSTALHVAVAVAVGAFGLAVAAIVHSLLGASGNLRLLVVALVAWPVITAIPAFFVAFAASVVLARLKP